MYRYALGPIHAELIQSQAKHRKHTACTRHCTRRRRQSIGAADHPQYTAFHSTPVRSAQTRPTSARPESDSKLPGRVAAIRHPSSSSLRSGAALRRRALCVELGGILGRGRTPTHVAVAAASPYISASCRTGWFPYRWLETGHFRLALTDALVTTTIRLRIDGRSTVYQNTRSAETFLTFKGRLKPELFTASYDT